MRPLIFVIICCTLFISTGCQEETPQPDKAQPKPVQSSDSHTTVVTDQEATIPASESESTAPDIIREATATEEPAETESQEQLETSKQEAPQPPIFEDFQGAPQLTLFPRVGDVRPEENSDRLPYWNTFIDHLVKVTGIAEDQTTGNRRWAFRSINSIDSVGYFSPLRVEPQTSYKISFEIAAELEEGASAGIGILKFNQFLWIPNQYTDETFKAHFRGSVEGKRLSGTITGTHTFTFTSGPDTRMIHIVLFREGTHDRNSVMFDNIGIEKVKGER